MNSLTDLHGHTVLVVEDDATLREALVEEFEEVGLNVLQAENGNIAFDVVQGHKVDGVISDVRMPGGDGVELLRRLQSIDHPPVLMFMTGYADLSVIDAYDLGAEAVLKKPFDIDDLTSTVARLLTPKERRWQQSSHSTSPHRVLRHYENYAHALDSGDMQLGRGGLFLRDLVTVQPGATVSLDIYFDATEDRVSGQAVVQWVRHNDSSDGARGAGLEFRDVVDHCIPHLLKLSGQRQPYIPKGCNQCGRRV